MLSSFHLHPSVADPENLDDQTGYQSFFDHCLISGIICFNRSEREEFTNHVNNWPNEYEVLKESFYEMLNTPRIIESNDDIEIDAHIDTAIKQCRSFNCNEFVNINKYSNSNIRKKIMKYHKGGIQLNEISGKG